jgi:phage anti-repressor protein
MELIKIEDRNGIDTVNARELWQALGSKQEFANWVKSRLDGFAEGQDFTVDKFINGRATQIDYHLTIDTAKHLAMLERNEKGMQIRQYFIEVEKKAKSLPRPKDAKELTHQTMAELRRAFDRGLISADEYRLGIGLKYPKADMIDPKLAKQIYAVACQAIERKTKQAQIEQSTPQLFGGE